MSVFLVVGLVGAALLLLTLVLGDVLDVPDVGGGVLSGVVLGGATGAFGLVGATVEGATGPGAAAAAGTAGALVMGALALAIGRSLTRMRSDRARTAADLLGVEGVVVTPVRAGSYGEVRLRVGGHPLKLSATAERDLAAGSPVLVVETLSSTAVRVLPF